MKCDNSKCYWHYKGQCVCESEEAFTEGRPNSMNCSYFLDKDFEKKFYETYLDCHLIITQMQEKINHRKFSQLRRCKMILAKANNEL